MLEKNFFCDKMYKKTENLFAQIKNIAHRRKYVFIYKR